MKKIRLFLLFATSAAVLGACSKTDNSPSNSSPVAVTITPSSVASIYGGDTVNFTVVTTSSNNLSTATFTQTLSGGSATQIGTPYTLSGTSERFTQKYGVPVGYVGSLKVTCTITDDKGNSDTASAILNVIPDYSTYSAVLLASYADPSGVGSFFSAQNGQVYTAATAANNQPLIDMVFFYGASNQYTLAAPNDGSFGTNSNQISSDGIQTWNTKNATSFYTITSVTDLSTINSGAAIAQAFTGATPYSPSTRANMLSVGQIIGFQTEGAKYGLAKIVNATGGDASGNGQITITVVVQK